MTNLGGSHNRIKARRLDRRWSQDELARRAGVSRAAVSAIEVERLVPSVAAALAIASALGCTVEELFGASSPTVAGPAWAWLANQKTTRFWQASVSGKVWFYPVEPTSLGMIGHDGIFAGGHSQVETELNPDTTLVMATCDPAAGLLAAEYARATGFRLIPLIRSSGDALELLKSGLVHAAGVHFATEGDDAGNARAAAKRVERPVGLLSVTKWEEGLAVGSGVSARSIAAVLKSDLAWVGREPGSAARLRLDELRPDAPLPQKQAFDHRGVAEAVRCGWADAGLCLRLAAEEAGVRVLGLRFETYDLCFTRESEADPRIQGLIRVVRSPAYRRLLGDLPGYDPRITGELHHVDGV